MEPPGRVVRRPVDPDTSTEGATVLGPASRSMTISGSVAEWESWTEMVFPEPGSYVVPEALGLVNIDRDRDVGTYVEENLWVRHS